MEIVENNFLQYLWKREILTYFAYTTRCLRDNNLPLVKSAIRILYSVFVVVKLKLPYRWIWPATGIALLTYFISKNKVPKENLSVN
jgi:hypothetical protein